MPNTVTHLTNCSSPSHYADWLNANWSMRWRRFQFISEILLWIMTSIVNEKNIPVACVRPLQCITRLSSCDVKLKWQVYASALYQRHTTERVGSFIGRVAERADIVPSLSALTARQSECYCTILVSWNCELGESWIRLGVTGDNFLNTLCRKIVHFLGPWGHRWPV